MHSIEPRMLDDATQPALWVDGQLIDYKSLRRLALRLQQPMLQMLKSAGPGWESGKGPVKESVGARLARDEDRSEEHTSELQSLMRISYAVFCLKKKKIQ